MPANGVHGSPAVVRHVDAQAVFAFARSDSYAFLTAIPSGGTVLSLPEGAADGDWYEWRDGDGSCGPGNVVTLAGSAGTTVGGQPSVQYAAPGASTKAIYDADARNWTVSTSLGGSALALAQDTWWIDPVHGNNKNDGKTQATAVQTLSAIVDRWGTLSPLLNQATQITWTSAPAPVDGWAGIVPIFGPNGSLELTGLMTLLATVTLGVYTPQVPAAGSLNTITAEGQSGAFWTPFVGKYVVDVTQGAYFFVGEDLGGGRAAISAPRVMPEVFPGAYATVADGDELQIYDRTTLPISSCASVGAAGQLQGLRFWRLAITATNLQYIVDEDAVFAECSSSNALILGRYSNQNAAFYGCYLTAMPLSTASPWSGTARLVGGWLDGFGHNFGPNTFLDGDIVVPARFHWLPGTICLCAVYFGQQNDVDSPAIAYFSIDESAYGPTRVWGPGVWSSSGNRLVNASGASFASVFLLTGENASPPGPPPFAPMLLRGSTSGYYFDAGTGTFVSEVMTPAGVDTRGGYIDPTSGDGFYNQPAVE